MTNRSNKRIAKDIDRLIKLQGRIDGNYSLIADKLSVPHLLAILELEKDELKYYNDAIIVNLQKAYDETMGIVRR